MNKLFTKIAALVLGMTMAVGVGVAVGINIESRQINAAATSTGTYEKVVTADGIKADDTIVIVNQAGTKALQAISTTSTKYGTLTDVTVFEGILSLESADVEEFKVETGYNGSGFSFKGTSNVSGYLYWTSGNSLATESSKSNKSSWTLSVSNEILTIANKNTSSRLIRYNSDRFACYTTDTGTTAQIFKKTSSSPTAISKIVFKNNGTDATSELNASGIKDYVSVGQNYINTISNNSKIYKGTVGLKFGTGSAVGNFTINFADSKKTELNGKKLFATFKTYSSDTGDFTFYSTALGNGTTISKSKSSVTTLTKFEIGVFTSTPDSLKIATSSTRGYLTELSFEDVDPEVTISYSGETSLEYDGSQTQTISMTATAVGIQGTISYVWTSSNSNCLALTSGSGTSSATFTIYSEGTNVSITVAAKVGTETKATSEAIVFNVTNKTFSGVLTITSSPTMNVAISREGSITYTLTGNTNTMDVIEVTSDDEDVIAFVDSENPLAYMILGDDGDKTTITLSLSSSTNNLEHYSKTQEITIVDAIPVTDIELNSDSITVKIGGDKMELVATLTPVQPTINGVVWTSSDTSVVTVSGSETTSEGKSTGVLTGVNVGTATITAASAYDPDNIFDTATVTVTAPDDKTLEDISIVAGAGYKQRYSEEDTSVDTTGLSVNAHYVSPTQSTYDETINVSATASGVDWTLDLVNSRIVVTYGGKTATLTISIVREFAKNKGEYRLTESNSIQVGDHIAIGGVAVSEGKDWSGKDFVMWNQASNNIQGKQITISSKNIIANDEANNTDKAAVYDIELVNGFVEGSYALKVGDKYLGSGSTSNRLQLKDNITKDSSFSFTYDSTIGLWKILCLSEVTNARNHMYVNANAGADYRLFACYENKEDDEGKLPSDYNYLKVFKFEYYVDEANEYATQFNDANICGTDIYTKASATKWSAQSTAFGKLMLGTQNLFTNGTGTGAEITECLERYDRVQYLYYNTEEQSTYNDFMKRVANGQVTPKTYYGVTLFGNTDTNNMVAIVVIVSVVSLTAIGGYFFLKKRREQN